MPSFRNPACHIQRLGAGSAPITTLSLSPDCTLLAVGLNDGMIEIKSTSAPNDYEYCFASPGGVTALLWHPTASVIFSACRTGVLHAIELDGKDGCERASFDCEGYIQATAISPKGHLLAAAHGHSISVFKDPLSKEWYAAPQKFDTRTLWNHDSTEPHAHRITHSIYFIGNDMIVLVFLHQIVLLAVDKEIFSDEGHINAPNLRLIGSTSVSPCGRYIRAVNLQDSLDVYDLHRRGYKTTIGLRLRNHDHAPLYAFPSLFLNDVLQICGHSTANVVFVADVETNGNVHHVSDWVDLPNEDKPTLLIAGGIRNGKVWVFVVHGIDQDNKIYTVDVPRNILAAIGIEAPSEEYCDSGLARVAERLGLDRMNQLAASGVGSRLFVLAIGILMQWLYTQATSGFGRGK